MFVRHLTDCTEFLAGDGSLLRELLHPDRDDLRIRYSLAHATVAVGRKTRPHKLRSSEVYYILDGQGRMYIDQETHDVSLGCAIYIRPGAVQSIENTGRRALKILCIVDPPWRKLDEELLQPQA